MRFGSNFDNIATDKDRNLGGSSPDPCRMTPQIARILDANANRAREALRVMEDYARFALSDSGLAGQLKALRHDLAAALARLPIASAILFRDTPGDVGTTIKTTSELARASASDVVIAAGKRLSEALRSLEEFAKTENSAAAAALEQLRYRGYALEQSLARTFTHSPRFADVRLYVLLTEALCAAPWQETLDEILAAARPGDGGRGGEVCIQLREKALPDGEFLRRARLLVEKCHGAGALALINDRPDIAILANADGVHLGQDDLPCTHVRQLAALAGRPDLIIGVSTERVEQAQQALRDGATYIGVGPMFPTTTKEKPRIAGPAYAAEALHAVPMPVVAIGGITLENLPQLTALGLRTVAVCSAIICSKNPGATTEQFLQALGIHP